MDEREQLALEWAQEMKEVDPQYQNAKDAAAADFILGRLRPTMKNVTFDKNKHRLAGVTHIKFGTRYILWDDENSEYLIAVNPLGKKFPIKRSEVVLNGKRYSIVENDSTTATAKVLLTLEDYKGAKPGTIVACNKSVPFTKLDNGQWSKLGQTYTSQEMKGLARNVLREGWNNEQIA